MKTKRIVKIPLRKNGPPAKPRLRAKAAAPEYEVEDYEVEAEPNMRFSHALFVVLVLHVIAVAGVFAFNSIKARQAAATAAASSAKASATPAPDAPAAPAAPAATPKPAVRTHTVAAGDTLGRIASRYGVSLASLESVNGLTSTSIIRPGQVLTIPGPGVMPKATPRGPAMATVVASVKPSPAPAKTAPSPARPAPATVKPAPAAAPEDGFYVVEKGDNPYSIAKKLGVSYKKLLEINQIQDPTKVQIGQKLRLPSGN